MKTFPNLPRLLDRFAIQVSSHLLPKDFKVIGSLAVLALAIIVLQEFGAQYAITRAYILRSVNLGLLSVVVLACATVAILLILLLVDGTAFVVESFTLRAAFLSSEGHPVSDRSATASLCTALSDHARCVLLHSRFGLCLVWRAVVFLRNRGFAAVPLLFKFSIGAPVY